MAQANSEHITLPSDARSQPLNPNQGIGEPPAHPAQAVSRRGMLMNTAVTVASIASATAIAAPGAVVPAAACDPDPAFAAIEVHRLAYEAHRRACEPWCRLEIWKPEVASVPETAALKGAVDGASDEMFAAALTLLDVAPTTIAGCVALLRYANNYVEVTGDDLWPDHLVEEGQEDDDDAPVRRWAFFLHAHVADALEKIAALGNQAVQS
jgi:hypothetical protein